MAKHDEDLFLVVRFVKDSSFANVRTYKYVRGSVLLCIRVFQPQLHKTLLGFICEFVFECVQIHSQT